MKPTEKRKLVARLIELYVAEGVDISGFICRPLNYFDYEKVTATIIEKEQKIQEEIDQEFTYENYGMQNGS